MGLICLKCEREFKPEGDKLQANAKMGEQTKQAYDSLLRDATTKLGSIREWFVDHVEFERTWHDEYMTAEPDELRLLGEILGVFDSE